MSKANKTRSINKQTNKKKRARKLDEVGPQAVTGLFHTTQTRDFNYS